MADNLWIEELDLSHCQRITDRGIIAVARESPGLRAMNLSWCRKLTDACLIELIRNCKMLKRIDISNCDRFSAERVAELRTVNSHIEVLWESKKKPVAQRAKEAKKALTSGI
jgi:hypothetical protein